MATVTQAAGAARRYIIEQCQGWLRGMVSEGSITVSYPDGGASRWHLTTLADGHWVVMVDRLDGAGRVEVASSVTPCESQRAAWDEGWLVMSGAISTDGAE